MKIFAQLFVVIKRWPQFAWTTYIFDEYRSTIENILGIYIYINSYNKYSTIHIIYKYIYTVKEKFHVLKKWYCTYFQKYH